ncbi:hypothetical protein GCM10010435_65390 [Winogradskya consettensis]|uniref:Uncharacterized protein n=1 Tax=Winogradskya consettensis TaxID=113560 RepID=A0A919T3B5_9ACTN|nr:hypothetical protein [Actinoplanes consettensis]GIM84896.1 hypothetical protein Aco04nite_93700 [Actinoplanes consettensis]
MGTIIVFCSPEAVILLGIEGYDPEWQHDAVALAAVHRARFSRLIGKKMVSGWLMWDLAARGWFADGPVILGFGETNVEITHRKFDECSISWDQVDMSAPVDWYGTGIELDWRADPHPALRKVRGKALREVNIIERTTNAQWRPRILHAVEFLFDRGRLAIYNAMDENGIADIPERDLPINSWRRVHVA